MFLVLLCLEAWPGAKAVGQGALPPTPSILDLSRWVGKGAPLTRENQHTSRRENAKRPKFSCLSASEFEKFQRPDRRERPEHREEVLSEWK